jgi:hypothetical protein
LVCWVLESQICVKLNKMEKSSVMQSCIFCTRVLSEFNLDLIFISGISYQNR